MNKNIVLAITGASGAIYGIEMLKVLKKIGISVHLILSEAARITIIHETNYSISDITDIAYKSYNNKDIAACMSSGSFQHLGMIIAPCSIKTMSEIANCITTSLISRAADVTIKEGRKLVLMVRETPLHYLHLSNMAKLAQIGVIIAPPVNAFYIKPKTIEDLVQHTVYRTLDLFGIEHNLKIKRWDGIKND